MNQDLDMAPFDFDLLAPSEHMLALLHPEPLEAIARQLHAMLNQQVAGSTVLDFKVCSEPDWLSGAVPAPDGPENMIIVRCGLAFEFSLLVQTPDEATHALAGVYSWVCVHLNDPDEFKECTWLDVGEDLASMGAKGALAARMYFA